MTSYGIKAGKLDVSIFSIIPLLVLCLFNSGRIILILLFSAAIHELGHIAVIKLCHNKIMKISIMLLGAQIELENKLLSYKKEVFIHLSGCAANLTVAALAFFLIRRNASDEMFFLLYCNLFFALFNLLPIKSLDGYNALRAAILMKAEPDTSDRIMIAVSYSFLIIVAIISIFVIYITKYNISLLLITFKLFSLSRARRNKIEKSHG